MQNLRSKRNIIIAISASLLLIVFEIINNKFIGSAYYNSSSMQKNVAAILIVFALICIYINLKAISTTKKWFKLIPVAALLMSFVILIHALFVWGFTGYASDY